MSGRTGHDIAPEVEAAVREADRASDAMKSALALLTHIWNQPTTTAKERRVMCAARQRARRSAT